MKLIIKKVEQVVMPFLNVLSKFRDDVRNEARVNKRELKF
jgi:hypothetical protein